MKKNNLFKIGANVLLAAIVAVIFVLSCGLAAGGLITIAITGAVVAGDPVTVEAAKAGSTIDKDHVSKKVALMRPSAYPLDTVMRNIRSTTDIGAFKTEFYAVDSRPLWDTVKTGYTKEEDGATTADINVNNIQMWSTADDTCMFSGITGSDGKDLVCFIISKNNENATIKVQPLNGDVGTGTMEGEIVMPSVALNTRVVRMGPAKNELDIQTSPYGIIPVKDYNYLQIFMAQIEEGTYQRMHEKEVDWDFSDYEALNVYDMRATTNFTYWFGYRKLFSDKVNGVQRYTAGGITRSITKALTYGTGGADRSIDNTTFVEWTKSIFTGNNGSDARYLFGGDGLMANLMKVDTILKQIEAKKVAVKFGITFKEIETNFGMLYFKHEPTYDMAGWGDNGVVLDLNNIEKHTFQPMHSIELDLIKSGQRNAKAKVLTECSCPVVRNPDTHAIIRPTA